MDYTDKNIDQKLKQRIKSLAQYINFRRQLGLGIPTMRIKLYKALLSEWRKINKNRKELK